MTEHQMFNELRHWKVNLRLAFLILDDYIVTLASNMVDALEIDLLYHMMEGLYANTQ